jgi:glycosyltransferase involved in cell wall biosynthesis
MPPLVSILIPAYNCQEWIRSTMESALAQSWPRKEIVIVDDGSRDQTLAVARQYASESVCIITQTNQGAAAARNKAFSVCQGDYIQWLDADDLLAPDKISKQMEALEECQGKRTLLSSAWGHFIYRPEKARFSPTSVWCDLGSTEWVLRHFEQNHWMQTGTWLISRELAQTIGPWDVRLSLDDDGEYFCRAVLASERVRFVPEAKVFYRRTANSLSYVGGANHKLDSQFLSIKLNIAHLRTMDDSQRARAACLKYLNRFLVYFYPERPDIVRAAQQLATELGSQLEIPRLSWKYVWVKNLFGWSTAKRTELYYNQFKTSLARFWDKSLYYLNTNSAE